MCGLAGFLGPVVAGTDAELQRMGMAIAHRGPDSHGRWTDADAGVAMAHRRLAVVDITPGGHQPMVSASGRYVLSFNGEVYNHRELRRALDADGAAPPWRGTSDTETILATIERHGVRDAVDRWVGMFAFALWDRQTRRLTLGRDRLGEKPMYYGWHRGRFLFASELGALRASDGFEPRIDPVALALYFQRHHVPAPHCIFEGLRKLQPGCLASMRHDGAGDAPGAGAEPSIEVYWSALRQAIDAQRRPFAGNLAEATDEVQRLLAQSVATQVVADVPVGAFLSGGIDSSAVVALMQATAPGSVRTFSVGFSEAGFDEAVHARAVARHLGTDHTEHCLQGDDALALVERLPSVADEPFADSSQLPTLVVSELARRSVTVSLSGDGGDELFGGYTRYARATQAIRTRRRAGGIGRAVARGLMRSPLVHCGPTGFARLAASLGGHHRARHAGRALQLLSSAGDSAAYRAMTSFWIAPASPVLALRASPATLAAALRAFDALDARDWLDGVSPQEAVQMVDLLNYLPDDILTKVDRASMHVSLESRIPLLDHRLVEFVWSLPPAFRAGTARPKQILRDIACRFVPRELIERPKMGFGVPLAQWLRGPLRPWADAQLHPRRVTTDGLLDAAVVARIWQAFIGGDDELADNVWGLVAFQAWYERLRGGRDDG